MTILLITLFWLASLLVVYPYIIYPVVLMIVNRLFDGRNRNANDSSVNSAKPSVSLIISAYNEAAVIEEKLRNALSMQYPGEFEVLVVSDASTDNTAELVKTFSALHKQVKLIEMDVQSGKTAGLNVAVPLCQGEILVFTDANAMFEPTAIEELVAPFDSPDVGYTVGSAQYVENNGEAVQVSEGLYWRYELAIKELESEFHSVVGGDGAIYAIRSSLYQPMLDFDISDFVNPLQIAAKKYRGVFVKQAISFEFGTDAFADEFRRKRRIVNRSWGAVRRNIGLFNVKDHMQYGFMLISHKIIRWWALLFVLIALSSSVFLFTSAGLYLYFFFALLISASILIALVGWVLDKQNIAMPRVVYLLYYFYLTNLAAVLGIYDDFKGKRQSIWQPAR